MTEDPYAASAALVGLPVPLIYDGPDNDQESPESPGLRQPDRQRAPDYIQLVRQRAQELITCIDDVESPTEQMAADFEAESVSQVKLKDMLQLSEDIHMNLERMSAMTRYHDDRRAPAIIPVPVRQSSDAVSEAGGAAMMHSKRRMNLTRRVRRFLRLPPAPGSSLCYDPWDPH